MKQLFNIKYRVAIENKRLDVETENGFPVKIVEWNTEGNYPVLGIIKKKSSVEAIYFDKKGVAGGAIKPEYQLYVVTKEKFKIGDTICNKSDANKEGKIIDITIDDFGNTYYFVKSLKDNDTRYYSTQIIEENSVLSVTLPDVTEQETDVENLTELEVKIRDIITDTLSIVTDDGTMSFSISISDKDYIIIKN